MDLFVVPTIGFKLLYGFVVVRLVCINVTANPTAEWVARQITEAFPWNEAPRYMIRDRDRIYGAVVTRRLRAMGIRDRPTAAASPWQNGFAERLIGSIRRECLDHVIVLGEGASAPNPAILCGLLQRRQNSSILGQGCASLSLGTALRCHSFTRYPGRTSSPLWSNLRFSVHTSGWSGTSASQPSSQSSPWLTAQKRPRANQWRRGRARGADIIPQREWPGLVADGEGRACQVREELDSGGCHRTRLMTLLPRVQRVEVGNSVNRARQPIDENAAAQEWSATASSRRCVTSRTRTYKLLVFQHDIHESRNWQLL